MPLCLRLLALVEILTRAVRLEPFFDVTPDGVDLHPSLLAAAAALPLDPAARFDEAVLMTAPVVQDAARRRRFQPDEAP